MTLAAQIHYTFSGSRASSAGQPTQRGHPGSEQVLASTDDRERRLRTEEQGRASLDRHLVAAGTVADQEVLVVAQAEGVSNSPRSPAGKAAARR